MTDGQSAILSWNKAPIWGLWPDIYYSLKITVLFLWNALSDERRGLSLVYATDPRQRRPSWVRVPLVSWSCFTVSDLRLTFSSPPTTRKVTVEVFNPASTRVSSKPALDPRYIDSGRPQQKTPFPYNSSIITEVCLPRRFIKTSVLILLRGYSFSK
jgi:hypothetical protein